MVEHEDDPAALQNDPLRLAYDRAVESGEIDEEALEWIGSRRWA